MPQIIDRDEQITDIEKRIGALGEELEKLLADASDDLDLDIQPRVQKSKKKKKGAAAAADKDSDQDSDADDEDADSEADEDNADDDEGVKKAKKSDDDDADNEDDDWSAPADKKKSKKMKKAAAGDDGETVTIAGEVISKAAVGDVQFSIFKKHAEELKKAQAEIAHERNLRETAELKKRADDEYSHLPGGADKVAKMLKALQDMPEELRKSFEAVMSSAEKLAKAAFTSVGHSGGTAPNGTEFLTKVSEIKSRDKCTQTEAMSKARLEYPDMYKAYQGN